MFNDPQLIQKLAANPKTSKFLSDPTFMNKLMQMKNNPNDTQSMFSDPRMIQVLGVLMGVDMSMMDGMGGMPGAGGDEAFGSKEAEEDVPMPDARPASTQAAQPKKAPTPEPEPEDEEAAAKAKAKAEADEEKRLGT